MSVNGLPPIAVIGMAGRFPGAQDLEKFWENLCRGVDCLDRRGSPEDATRHAGGVRDIAARGILPGRDEFDAEFFGISAREAELMDPQHRVFLECAWTALESAAYTPDSCPTAVSIYGTCNVNDYASLARSATQGPAERFAAHVANLDGCLATRVAHRLDLRGEAITVQTACSSSLVALHLAVLSLRAGQSDLSLVGGVNIAAGAPLEYQYQEGMIYSADGYCRPFSEGSTGMVEGEGVGVVVLKRLDEAVADGDQVRAVIRGTAVNNDGRSKAAFTAPSVTAQAEVVVAAMRSAGVGPGRIGYVEAHGTATTLGDSVEVEALTRAYRSLGNGSAGSTLIGSVKSNIGHLIQAAGVAGLIKAVLCVERGTVPPLANFLGPSPLIPFAETPFAPSTDRVDWPIAGGPRLAAVSSFGIGGTNAHAIVEQAPPRAPGDAVAGPVPVVVSAATPAGLETVRTRLAEFCVKHPDVDVADVAYTLAVGRVALECRWLAWVSDLRELVVAAEQAGGQGQPPESWREETKRWLAGADVSWREAFEPHRRLRIELPTHPFEGERHWLADDPDSAPAAPTQDEKSDDADADQPENVRSTVTDVVTTAFGRALSIDEPGLDDDLFAMGGDSMTVLMIALDCEDELGIEVPLEATVEVRTPSDLIVVVEGLARDARGGGQ